jgi:hypothetical protein
MINLKLTKTLHTSFSIYQPQRKSKEREEEEEEKKSISMFISLTEQ